MKSYKYGVKETLNNQPDSPEPDIKETTDNKIDPHEQAYIQFEHQRNMEKIDEIYYKALDKLHDAHGEILEKIMKKHHQIKQEKNELNEKEKKRLWKISMGKL